MQSLQQLHFENGKVRCGTALAMMSTIQKATVLHKVFNRKVTFQGTLLYTQLLKGSNLSSSLLGVLSHFSQAIFIYGKHPLSFTM